MPARDPYEVLGVSRDAGPDEIRSAYKREALKWHPDRNPGSKDAEARFKAATEAYHLLKDLKSAPGPVPRARDGPEFYADMSDFESVFGEMFSKHKDNVRRRAASSTADFFETHPRRSGERDGKDVEQDLHITMEESVLGATKTMKCPSGRRGSCPECDGRRGLDLRPCTACLGSGRQGFGVGRASSPKCKACQGFGDLPVRPCTRCTGTGHVKQDREVVVKVPAGIRHGQKLRLAGMGGPGGPLGGSPGDLFVTIHVMEDACFERRGSDLYVRREISLMEAMRGSTVSVAAPGSSPMQVKVPPDMQPGVPCVVFQGCGFVEPGTGKRGNLHVIFQVRLPRIRTPRAAKLMEELLEELESGPQ